MDVHIKKKIVLHVRIDTEEEEGRFASMLWLAVTVRD